MELILRVIAGPGRRVVRTEETGETASVGHTVVQFDAEIHQGNGEEGDVRLGEGRVRGRKELPRVRRTRMLLSIELDDPHGEDELNHENEDTFG